MAGGMVVATNVMSINAQRNLNKSNSALGQSMERLSSGLRINSAKDDAAGMAISTRFSSQIRGMTQASRNANDGMSLIRNAGGVLSGVGDIMQRIRDLAVQAANDLLTPEDRAVIQKEVDEQIAELTRLGDTTDFNGKKLFNGTFTNMKLQVGSDAYQTIEMSLSDFRSEAAGKIAINDGGTNAVIGTAAISGAATGAGSVTIISSMTKTAVTVGSSAGLDKVSYWTGTVSVDGSSAIAKAAAINAVTDQTGVRAAARATVATGGAITAGSTGANIQINGVTVVGAAGSLVVQANDSDFALRNRINSYTEQTGVVASLDGSNNIVLTAKDGRNITVGGTGFAAGTTGLTGAIAGVTTGGKVEMWASEGFTVTSGTANVVGQAAGAVSIGKNADFAVSKIKVTTHDEATKALRIIDAALSQVTKEQAMLGAKSNRLENTMSNLAIGIENMSAARSAIMDTDFASETANLTRNQILTQAGVAMNSQANMIPQQVLALLGG